MEIKNIFKDYDFNLFVKNICDHIYKYDFVWNEDNIPPLLDVFNSVKYKDPEDIKNYKDDPKKLLDDPPIWFLYHNVFKLCLDIKKRNGFDLLDDGQNIDIINDFLYLLTYFYTGVRGLVVEAKIINLIRDICDLHTNIRCIYNDCNIYIIISETTHFFSCKKINKKHVCDFFGFSYDFFLSDDTDNKICKFKKDKHIVHNYGNIFITKYCG